MAIEKTKRVVQLSSNANAPCQHCDDSLGPFNSERLMRSINHYIEAHGYELLHVGSEHDRDGDGTSIHHTVAVLGHDNPPAVQPPPKIEYWKAPTE